MDLIAFLWALRNPRRPKKELLDRQPGVLFFPSTTHVRMAVAERRGGGWIG